MARVDDVIYSYMHLERIEALDLPTKAHIQAAIRYGFQEGESFGKYARYAGEVLDETAREILQENKPKTKILTRRIGIPLDDVAPRLEELNKALEEHGMALGAETSCNLEIIHSGRIAKSATITVYFFQKHEIKNSFENLGNSEAVKKPEE